MAQENKGQRLVSGNIAFKDGLPSAIDYRCADGCHFTVYYTYASPVREQWRIPSEMLCITRLPNGFTNGTTMKLLSLVHTKYPAGATGPNPFLKAAQPNSVWEKQKDGRMRLIGAGPPPAQKHTNDPPVLR
jgi:hypothetical protein